MELRRSGRRRSSTSAELAWNCPERHGERRVKKEVRVVVLFGPGSLPGGGVKLYIYCMYIYILSQCGHALGFEVVLEITGEVEMKLK